MPPWVTETWADDGVGAAPQHYRRGWGGTNATLLTDYARRAPGRYVVVGDTVDSDPSYVPMRRGMRAYAMGASAAMPTGGGNNGVWYARPHLGLPDPDEMWWGYTFCLSERFNPAPQGGKLPGWDGRYSRKQYRPEIFDELDPPFAGNGGSQSTGANGWSARGGYRSPYARPYDAAPGTPEGFAGLANDATWQRGERRHGAYCYVWSLQEHVTFTGRTLPFAVNAQKGRWYGLTSHVRLNTVSADEPLGRFDGLLEYWLREWQGDRWGPTQRVCQRTDLRFRKWRPTGRQVGVNGFWLTFQHGGVPDWTVEDTYCYVGAVAIGPGPDGLLPYEDTMIDPATISGTHEGGSMSGAAYLIDAKPDPGTTKTLPFDFVVPAGALGTAPKFVVNLAPGTATPHTETGAAAWRAWFSHDDLTWTEIADVLYDAGDDRWIIQCPTFTQDRVRIANNMPVDYTAMLAAEDGYALHAHCEIATLTTLASGRPIRALTITDPAVPDAGKTRLLWMRSGHAINEHHATRRVNGGLQWALGASPEAALFRQRNILHVLFCTNPDGHAAGLFRVTPAGIEQNRWESSAAATLASKGPEAGACHAYIEALMALSPSLLVFMDHHTTGSATTGTTVDYAQTGPNWSSLGASIAVFDGPAGNLIRDTVGLYPNAPVDASHNRLAAQFPALRSFIVENGQYRHHNGTVPTIASLAVEGEVLLRAVDRWLHP